MLILGRTVGQQIVIDGTLVVTVTEESEDGGNHVRLRLDAHGDTRHVRIPSGSWRTIGDGIEATYRGHLMGNASIGIDAPKSVQIDRKEIHDRKVREIAERGSSYPGKPRPLSPPRRGVHGTPGR